MFFKRRGGQKARWRLVVALELIKAICRTIMFWVTGRRMVIEGSTTGERPLIPEHPQERNPQDEPPQETETLSSGGAVSAAAKDHETAVQEERTKEWNMPRTGMKLPVLPTQGGESITDFLSKRVISADDIKVASQLVRKISSYQGQLAEMMWIARPVVYALAMQRLQGTAGSKRSYDWRPWVLGFGMEVAARELGKKAVRERTGLEKAEWRRRGWGMAWWGMRGAFYDHVTKCVMRDSTNDFRGFGFLLTGFFFFFFFLGRGFKASRTG